MEPLASQIRPTILDDYVGQEHLVGVNKPLRKACAEKHLFSFILWGPPGTGKTTLAKIYGNCLGANFFELSAVSAGKDDVRHVIAEATKSDKPTILFLDEIHRFNKAQQDFLLPHVESGKLTLIGATTENPSFEVISPLLSRCRVFILKELTEEELGRIIDRAKIQMPKETKEWLVNFANGDARQALTILDNTLKLYGKITIENLINATQSKKLRFDKTGEEHFNTISAFIKSMRASQPEAVLYYLARLIEGGEDPLFIARRMVIFASEDIGLANASALGVANAVFRACETIGYPECQENLAHGAVYLAKSPKDRSAYDAYFKALDDVKNFGNLPIPLKIRNPVSKLMKEVGYGKDYDMRDKEDLRPDEVKDHKYF